MIFTELNISNKYKLQAFCSLKEQWSCLVKWIQMQPFVDVNGWGWCFSPVWVPWSRRPYHTPPPCPTYRPSSSSAAPPQIDWQVSLNISSKILITAILQFSNSVSAISWHKESIFLLWYKTLMKKNQRSFLPLILNWNKKLSAKEFWFLMFSSDSWVFLYFNIKLVQNCASLSNYWLQSLSQL